jgi:hypothetical protein
MPRTDMNQSGWSDFENETLVHNHKLAKVYKKRYQRACDFHNSLYRFFGLITVVATAVSSTIAWGIDEKDKEQQLILSSITTVSAISAAVQNFYKFQENANNYITTAKSYAKLQNKIEGVGNIHPEYRTVKPCEFMEKIQDRFNKISDSRLEVSNCMSSHFYTKSDDDESYLYGKHKKYKLLKEEEKLEYSKETSVQVDIQIETDDDSD